VARKVRTPRAKKPRKVKRWNPDTGRAVQVDADSWEAENWPTRKPPAQTKAQKAVTRRVEREVTTTARNVLRRAAAKVAAGAAAVGAPVGVGALGVAAYVAIAGAVSYLATKAILDGAANGETPANLAALAFAKAHRELARQLGRQGTPAELKDLYRRIAIELSNRMRMGSVPGGSTVQAVLDLFRRH
jgi:hypothetical protein